MSVQYLSGHVRLPEKSVMIANGLGLIIQPRAGYDRHAYDFPFWAADNGCFSDRWEEDHWMRWLDRLPRDRCLFAVAPDVYPDAEATLKRSRRYFQVIREMGYPVAFVAQDGAESLQLPWDDFDCLFIGGKKTPRPDDEWKVGKAAEELAHRARKEGKWVHMGRVNSQKRMIRARDMGCNSADGTYIKYCRRLRAREAEDLRDTRGAVELARWVTWLEEHPGETVYEMPHLPVHRDAVLRRRGDI